MSRLLIAALLVATTLLAHADNAVTIQRVIDETVWKPFHDAFEEMDGEALNALYADDVLRATPEGLDTEGAFKRFNATRFDANRANGDRIELDFWMDSRRTNESTSYEVGFYRISIVSPDATATFHGQFHIVLKSIDGVWQITQDWDTDSIGGRPITAEDFARQPAIAW